MIYDLSKLAIIGLGSDGTAPKPDGNHLRWAFGTGLSFPDKGFALYRRKAKRVKEICWRPATDRDKSLLGEFAIGDVKGRSLEPVILKTIGRDLGAILAKRARSIRLDLPRKSRLVRVTLSGESGAADLEALSGTRVVGRQGVKVRGQLDVVFEALGIDALRVGLNNVTILKICIVPDDEKVGDDPRKDGWDLIAQLDLPQTFNDVPPRIFDRQSELEGAYKDWAELAIKTIRDPGDPVPPAERVIDYIDGQPNPVPHGTSPGADVGASFNALSLLLLGALEPNFARMLGLAFVDQTAVKGQAYDYLIVGRWNPEPRDAIFYGLVRKPAAALAPPTGLAAAPFGIPIVKLGDTGNAVGLTWSLTSGSSAPLTYDPILFDVEGAKAGAATAAAPTNPPSFSGNPLNLDGPIVVGTMKDAAGNPFRPTPFFTHFNVPEGWEGYALRGIDIFGRVSAWSPPAFALLLDHTPPPAPRLLNTVQDGVVVQVPVQARYLDLTDPQLATADRARLTAAGQSVGTVVQWTWYPEQRDVAPDAKEFRVYRHPAFPSAGTTVSAVGAPSGATTTATLNAAPPFDAVGGRLVIRGDAFPIVSVAGATLTLARLLRPKADGSVESIDPTTGAATLLPAIGNPRKWAERVGVLAVDAATPAKEYEILIPGALPTSVAQPVGTAWIGVTAVDDKSYAADDPARIGPNGGRTGNESEIAVRARVTAVDRTAPTAPQPAGPLFASRADFYGLSRYTLAWTAAAPTKYHVWRAVESILVATDMKARLARAANTYYATHGSFDDDPGFAAWLAANHPGVTQAAILTATQTPAAKAAWLAWAKRFYDRATLSDVALQAIAGRTPNERAFVQLTKEPLAAGRYDDEFDGRIAGRYVYRVQGVNPNGLTGPLGLPANPVSLHDVLPPDRPAIVKVAIGNRAATLTWNANRESDLAHYELYRAPAGTGEPDPRTMDRRGGDLPKTQTAYADTGLAPGARYRFVLVAVDNSGNKSLPSLAREAVGVATAALAAPTVAGHRDATGSAILTWTPPEDGTRGFVERRLPSETAWRPLSGWLPTGQTAFEDATSAPASTYRLRLRDAAGNVTATSAEITVA